MSNWFIALTVEPGVWFERVQAPPAGVRLFQPEDLHLTVAFLGPVGELRARRAFEVAAQWPTPCTSVRLGEVVAMGSRSRPSALSALLTEGRDELAAGMLAVRDAMTDAAQVPREARPPLPHVTLARPPRNADSALRHAALHWAATLELGAPSVQVSTLALYTRAEGHTARLFRTIQSHRLPPA